MIVPDAFTKTRCRQESQFRHDGKLVWRKHPTPPGAPIDALLQQNVAALHSHPIILARTHAEKLRDASSEGFRAPNLAARHSPQGCLFPYSLFALLGVFFLATHSPVLATPEPLLLSFFPLFPSTLYLNI